MIHFPKTFHHFFCHKFPLTQKKGYTLPYPHRFMCSLRKMIQTYTICGKPAIFYNSLFSNKVTPEIHCFSIKNKSNTANLFRLSYLIIKGSKSHSGPSLMTSFESTNSPYDILKPLYHLTIN